MGFLMLNFIHSYFYSVSSACTKTPSYYLFYNYFNMQLYYLVVMSYAFV